MNVVMLGLQQTGKTSYAVGLHSGAANGAFEKLRILSVDDPVATLNQGLKRLAARLPVERTDADVTETMALTVEIEGEETHELRIPDRSGEALRGSLQGRSWHPELLAELRAADGLMLFINPLRLNSGAGVEEVGAIVEKLDEDHDEEFPWMPALMPTDAAMVDALQEIKDATRGRVTPIVVVISAWDVVKAGAKPMDWLGENVPLLAQYLASGGGAVEAFGVSVQGESFDPADETPVAADEPDPWDRATCVNAAGDQTELSAPLVWLLRSGG